MFMIISSGKNKGREMENSKGKFTKLRGLSHKDNNSSIKSRLSSIQQTNQPTASPEECPECGGSSQVDGRRFNLKKRSVGKTSPPNVDPANNDNVICVNVSRKDRRAAELHLELDDLEEDFKTVEPWSIRKQHLMQILASYITYTPTNSGYKYRKMQDVAERALRIFFIHSDERDVYLKYKEIYQSESPDLQAKMKKFDKTFVAVGNVIMGRKKPK